MAVESDGRNCDVRRVVVMLVVSRCVRGKIHRFGRSLGWSAVGRRGLCIGRWSVNRCHAVHKKLLAVVVGLGDRGTARYVVGAVGPSVLRHEVPKIESW